MKYLLDTHVLLWWYLDAPELPKKYKSLLEELESQEESIGISVLSLWEIAKLEKSGRIRVSFSLNQWFRELEEDPLLNVLPLNGLIILESTRLGESFPKDPADQLIAATARVHHLRLLTADERIRSSGAVLVQ